jgi:hypothetical protein
MFTCVDERSKIQFKIQNHDIKTKSTFWNHSELLRLFFGVINQEEIWVYEYGQRMGGLNFG